MPLLLSGCLVEEYELPLSHWQIRAVPEGQCIFRLLCLGQDLIKTTENGSVMDVPSLSFTTHSQRETHTQTKRERQMGWGNSTK